MKNGSDSTASATHLSGRQDPALLIGLELASKSWRLCSGRLGSPRERQKRLEVNELGYSLRAELKRAKERLGLPEDAPIVLCYEAGRDGFWPCRYLQQLGIQVLVVDPSSIEVPRRQRRRKTDRLDARKLLAQLRRHVGGEHKVWSLVSVPSEAAEDERHLYRERQALVRDQTRLRNRISSKLAIYGIKLASDGRFPKRLEQVQTRYRTPLPAAAMQGLQRLWQHLQFVQAQIKAVERAQATRVKTATTPAAQQIRQLMQLRGLGPESSTLLVDECFGWRPIRRARDVGPVAGLVPVPFASGSMSRDQGISKTGPRRLRAGAIELAWGWVRHQPRSTLTHWFLERFNQRNKRERRIGIVALARKLLIALWKYLQYGELPEGAVLKA